MLLKAVKHSLPGAIITLLCSVIFFCACATQTDRTEANVLLYWPTDESDPSYRKWTEIALEELSRQGISGDVQVHFAHVAERYESRERTVFNELILKLRAEGKMPDIILSYGDANRWLLITNTNPVTASIPVVCFGIKSEEFLPYQYEFLEEKYEGGRWNGMVNIRDRMDLEPNLVFANEFSSRIIDKIRNEDFLSVYPNRLVTLLDVPNLWNDRLVFNILNRQMDKLDQTRFYNNLLPSVTEDRVRQIARNENRIVFSCRSVMAPLWNIKTTSQISTTWAFYPQKSSNFFIQTKHDNKARGLVEGPSFLPYGTMVAEDFLVNDKCIGGYFPTAESQIRDAVSAGLRLLKGEKAEDLRGLEHTPTYNVNWDVLRGKGLNVNNLPPDIQVYNAELRDRNPKLYKTYLWTGSILVAVILLWSAIIIIYYSRKARRNELRMREYANETIRNNDLLTKLMKTADFSTWKLDKEYIDRLERINASDFFKEKILNFLRIEQSGKYTLQAYCSIDGKPYHWYELRMTVTEAADSSVLRSGVMVNIDSQKQLEAIEAETNRIITAARTREGFIASMNHEIRTPLNSVVGYAQLLAMPDMPFEAEELAEYTSAIDSNSALLQHTIRNILTAARISKTQARPYYERVNLCELVRGRAAQAQLEGRSFALDAAGESDISVKADRIMLTDVLDNILFNAALFSQPDTEISVSLRATGTDAAEIQVCDHGLGIAPENRELIFDRFFKVNSFTPGCGLGLYICRTFVEAMGGKISVESTPGQGSTFKIVLG